MALPCALAASATAQPSDFGPTHRFGWSENAGFIDFRGIPAGPDAPRIAPSPAAPRYLRGYAWAENIGWIRLGRGSPTNGVAYANTSGSDWGVNIDPGTGDLFGLAWSENTGWINFDTRPTLAGSNLQARIDFAAGLLRGYAWSPNLGWINLDDPDTFVALRCQADLTGSSDPNEPTFGLPDGDTDGDDFFYFLDAFTMGQTAICDLTGSSDPNEPSFGVPDADCDGDDFFFYLDLFAGGCP